MSKARLLFFFLPLLHVAQCFCLIENNVSLERESSCSLSSVSDQQGDENWRNPNLVRLQNVAKHIESAQHILVVTGAGASVAAQIPDFRSPGTGLYDNLAKYDLPYPEAVFELNFFRQNPLPFVALSRDLFPSMNKARPTLTHLFLKALHDHDKLLRIYTQNIDGLDLRAETPPNKIIECHGHFRTASCSTCGKKSPIESVVKTMIEDGQVPLCEACGNPVKPDITFFGEDLPSIFSENIEQDTDKADLLLVFGTSLNVAPVALVPSFVDRTAPRVLFNREHIDMEKSWLYNDIFIEGDCDTNVKTLVQLLGWQIDTDHAHQQE